MGYQKDLLVSIQELIAGHSRCSRRDRGEILGRLELVCVEARQRGDLDFFLEIRAVVATPSKNWLAWLKTSRFRAGVNDVVRRYGLGVFTVALMQLEAVLAARQHGGLSMSEVRPADEVSG